MGGKTATLTQKVLITLRAYAMLDSGEKAVVAVSGGPDSVCVLHVLHELGYPPEVAHFDHQTRDGESVADARFVRELAKRLGVPFHVESRPIQQEAESSSLSFEEYARKARYEFLIRRAVAVGSSVIATGHHADDQAETVLMRILRGASPSGLAGIPPVREEGGVRIVRPLIACTRQDILAYLDGKGLSYRTDRSNADTRYVRNKIRHELLPQLCQEYNPKLRQALCRLSDAQRSDNDLLAAMTKSFIDTSLREDRILDRERFAQLHPAIQRRAVLMLAWRNGLDCPFDRVEEAAQFIVDGQTGRAFDLGGGILLRNGRDSTEVVTMPGPVDETVRPLSVPGVTIAFGKRIQVRHLEERPPGHLAEYCSPSRQVFDADALGEDLALRHRRPGDRFTPYGMTGSKKLKDYFIDLGVPATQRDTEIVLVGNGKIAWIVGHAVSAYVVVTHETKRILEIEVTDAVE